MRGSRTLLAVFVVAALCPVTAHAYRTSEDSLFNQGNGVIGRIAFEPLPVRWSLFRGSDDVELAALRAATATAFETWTEPACSGLTVADDGLTSTPAIYGDDQNVLEWVETGWASRGFGAFTIGVTTNQFLRVGDRWTIDESDMELNGDGYRWVIEGGEPDADPVDVQGLVVHEAGHFLGLLHTCEASAFDGAPACPPFSETPTMAPRYTGQEQRTLSADDVAGICYLYSAPSLPDAGVPDAGPSLDAAVTLDAGPIDGGPPAVRPEAGVDAGVPDAGATPVSRDGCSCRATGGRGGRPLASLLLGALACWVHRRRRV